MNAPAKILVAVDFSETASLALTHASQLARRHAAELVLAHVVEPLPVVSYPILMVPLDAEIELRSLAQLLLQRHVRPENAQARTPPNVNRGRSTHENVASRKRGAGADGRSSRQLATHAVSMAAAATFVVGTRSRYVPPSSPIVSRARLPPVVSTKSFAIETPSPKTRAVLR